MDSSPTGRSIRYGVNSRPQSPARTCTIAPGPIGSSQAGPKARGMDDRSARRCWTRSPACSPRRARATSGSPASAQDHQWCRGHVRCSLVRGPSSVKSTAPGGQTSRAPTSPSPWSTIRSAPRTCLVPRADNSEGSRSSAVSKLCWRSAPRRGCRRRSSPAARGRRPPACEVNHVAGGGGREHPAHLLRPPAARTRTASGTRRTRSRSGRPRSGIRRRRRSRRWCSRPAG